MSRKALDSSTNSSTGANIQRFIQQTKLADDMTEEKPRVTSHSLGNYQLNPISEESTSKSNENSHIPDAYVDSIELPDNGINNDNNQYKNMLKYKPNDEFEFQFPGAGVAAKSRSPSVSIPNTFKYKSHPNAKTKTKIGIDLPLELEDTSPEENIVTSDKMVTSTLNNHPVDFNQTPEWMPAGLEDKWDHQETAPENESLPQDFSSSVKITRKSSNLNDKILDLGTSSTNTMIFNSKPNNNETPMWKKINKEYLFQKQSQPQLRNIFLTVDSLKLDPDKANGEKQDTNNHSISSTISTPMMTMNKSGGTVFNTQRGHAEDQGQFPISNPESPLKLFADNYNTYTRTKLGGILENLKPTPKTAEKSSITKNRDITANNTDLSATSNLKIKDFTRLGSYTEEQFIQNANNVFKNLQKRGFKGKSSFSQPMNDTILTHTDSTSTPKSNKIQNNINDELASDENSYSSFTSGYEGIDDDDDEDIEEKHAITNRTQNEYTSFDHSETSHGSPSNDLNSYGESNLKGHTDSSYTFDEFTDQNGAPETFQDQTNLSVKSIPAIPPANNTTVSNEGSRIYQFATRLQELESIMKQMTDKEVNFRESYEKLQQENELLKQELKRKPVRDIPMEETSNRTISVDDADLTELGDSNVEEFIKWKRASQLRLQEPSRPKHSPMKEIHSNDNVVMCGSVKPGIKLPSAYDNMVLDTKNQKWVANDKENQYGSLDSIEDLVTNSDDENKRIREHNEYMESLSEIHETSILKTPKKSPKRGVNRPEVSFDLPAHVNMIDNDGLSDDHESISVNSTETSQLHDLTFSQIRKKLVAVITDILSDEKKEVSWSKVVEISLANNGLENIKDLNKFLPNLTKVDLSHNGVKYLEGLPKKTLHVDVSNNVVDNITSFKQFHDLQFLDASYNNLSNLSNLSHNIHLSNLLVNNNSINSLQGIKTLQNLSVLDVSQNDLMGTLDFKKFNLVNLQELNLSENKLQSVSGIECLPNLRILNLNENNLISISCLGKHAHLKKLLVKFNQLKTLSLDSYPFLRVLRFDGNALNDISDLKKLRFLEEVSCKSQKATIVDKVVREIPDVTKLDLSGNSHFEHMVNEMSIMKINPFYNLNSLVLSAVGLSSLPHEFSHKFPNVRELNLNFNKLVTLDGLAGMKNLKKLYLLSNNIHKFELILLGLRGSRSCLKVIDLRLNPLNLEHYPYVFNPHELEYSQFERASNDSPITLESLDDIESFAIHYKSLAKSGNHDWSERDAKFVEKLLRENSSRKFEQRLNYETMLISFFHHLRELDGGLISATKRENLRQRIDQGRISPGHTM